MTRGDFPKDFRWGTATAAYQIEGAAAEGGRGPSIWDSFSRNKGAIDGGDTGDVACDHYHLYKDDVALISQLGLNSYRFSVSWSRVFPEGFGKVNAEGVSFYERLVDELLGKGIEPMLTLYHWDLPEALQKSGGWAERDTIERFADYSRFIFDVLGDRVNLWNTLNEPWVSAYAGHRAGRHAPGIKDMGTAIQVSHHLMLAHARAVAQFRDSRAHDGKIGLALNLYPIYPASDSKEDHEASRVVDGYHNRWFLDPVINGTYPRDMLDLFAGKFGRPRIAAADMAILGGEKADFVGINYYFRKVIAAGSSTDSELNFDEIKPKESSYTAMGWEVYPEGLYDLLVRIRKDYGDIPLAITENGAAYPDPEPVEGVVDDPERREFLQTHFEAALKAIRAGVKLESYYVWSLLDNFEWAFGYSKRFGIFHVDYKTQKRTWKKSARWLQGFLGTGSRT